MSRKIYVDDEKNEVVEKAKTVEKIFGYEVSIIINKNLSLDFSVKKNYFYFYTRKPQLRTLQIMKNLKKLKKQKKRRQNVLVVYSFIYNFLFSIEICDKVTFNLLFYRNQNI